MASSSKNYQFTDRLPLELRRETYRLVLQREQAVTLTPKMQNGKLEFDGSLFRVNKAISQESLAVFFESNTVHIQSHQISDLINRYGSSVRRLHIENSPANEEGLVSSYLEAAATLLRYRKLTPRLRTVTFECKGLHVTVREVLEYLSAAEEKRQDLPFSPSDLQCVGVGSYLLSIPALSQEWHFSYGLLADLWASRCRQKKDYQPSADDDENYFSLRGPLQIPKWAYAEGRERLSGMQIHNLQGLAHQVSCYGAIEDALLMVKSRSAQLEVLRRFELMADWRIKKPVLEQCVDLCGRIRLRDVRKDYGSSILEWATELLAPNTKDYAAEFGHSIDEARECLRWNQS